MRNYTAGLGKGEAGKGQEIDRRWLPEVSSGNGRRTWGAGTTSSAGSAFSEDGVTSDSSLDTRRSTLGAPPKIVVIGASLGGLHALEVLLTGLPKNLGVPVAIAQHRHKDTNESLSAFLQHQCLLPVTEAEDKEAIAPGRVYLAPADYHLLVEAGHFALSTEAPVRYARPSIDVLFESVAEAYGNRAIGAILTGASNDGARGLLRIKAHGGLAVVQEPATAECSVMPRAAIYAFEQQRLTQAPVGIDWIVPLGDIAPLIVKLCHRAPR